MLIIAKATPVMGGTFNYTRSIIQLLSESDKFEVEVVSADVTIGGRSVTCSKLSIPQLISYILRQRSFDAVFCPTYFLPLFLFRGSKFVTIHDFQERYLPENFSAMQRLWRRFTHFMTELANPTYLCESEYVKSDITKFIGVPSSRIAVAKVPSLMSEFDKSLAALGNTLRDLDVFYPAKFWKHKNHIIILKALALLKSKGVVVNATFTGGAKRSNGVMYSLVNEYQLSDQVTILGAVSFDEIIQLYRRAKLLIMPSYFESISIPIYEAFSADVAVIAASLPGIKEQCGNAVCYFDCDDEITLADNIIGLLTNEEEYASKVKNGRKVLEDLATENYVERFREIVLSN